MENIDIDIDIDKDNLKNIDIDIDIDMAILENIDIDIDIDKGILQNIDIDKISYRLGFGISNTPKHRPHHRQSLDLTPRPLQQISLLCFSYLSFGIRHETQQAVATPYRRE